MNHDLGNVDQPSVASDDPVATTHRRRRAWLKASAAAAIVAGGALGGMALGQPDTSSAQTDTTDATDSTASATDHGPGHFGGPRIGGLDAAAEALGLTTDELRTALHDGSTLAELAADKGVDVDTLITTMVASAVEQLDAAVAAGDIDEAHATEIKANLTERITAMVNGEMRFGGGPGGFGGGHGGAPGPGGHHGRGMHLDTAAEVLGLEVDALQERLQAGETLADIAEAEGVDVDTLIDALVDDARTRITDMVNGVRPELPTDSTDSTSDAETSALTA
jgi:lambda repressor-like predicted transcriptional regulator